MRENQLPEIRTAVPGPLSTALWKERESYLPRGVSNSTKIFAKRASGALIEDVDGNVFLDFAGGIGVINAGHAPPEVIEAINEQASAFIHTSINVVSYDVYTRLARLLCEKAPVENARVLLVNSGAECVENAVKIARRYTGRPGIVTVDGSFHGRTLLTMTMTTKVKPYKEGFGPFAPDVYRIPCPNVYRRPDGVDEEAFALGCAAEFERMLATSLIPDMVAGVVVEPVQGEGGFIPMPASFLRRIREICTQYGIVLIVDEIQSGIARTGTLFAVEQSGVRPDLLTSSKSLAAGLPLGAVIGRAEIMDASQVGGIGGTFSGNPVACAAAIAVLGNVERYSLCERAREIGETIRTSLTAMQRKFSCIGDVRGLGAMIGMEFVRDSRTKEPDAEMVSRIIGRALNRGAIFLNAGLYGNVIRFLPPLTMTPEQLDAGLAILSQSIEESYAPV